MSNELTQDEIKLLLEMLQVVNLQGSSQGLAAMLARIETIRIKLQDQLQQHESSAIKSEA